MTTPTPELVALLELSERATRGKWKHLHWGDKEKVESVERTPGLPIVKDVAAYDAENDAAFVCALVNWFRSTRAATVPQGGASDSGRLDWLDAQRGTIRADHESWLPTYVHWGDNSPHKTLRAAIDAAMTPPPAELGKGNG